MNIKLTNLDKLNDEEKTIGYKNKTYYIRRMNVKEFYEFADFEEKNSDSLVELTKELAKRVVYRKFLFFKLRGMNIKSMNLRQVKKLFRTLYEESVGENFQKEKELEVVQSQEQQE